MKLYQIVFSYLEPCQAACQIGADSEEEAVNKLRSEAETQVTGFEVVSIVEVGEFEPSDKPPVPKATPQFEPLPDNVIMFPGNNTKH